MDLTSAFCSIPSPPVPPSLPRALVCPHMFRVPPPFAGAAVIGKPGVLLFQRPGSVEREVILGPWRRALEHGGGRRADKNQASLRQEHADVHTHRLPCTYAAHALKYANSQMHSFRTSCTFSCFLCNQREGMHTFNVTYLHILLYTPTPYSSTPPQDVEIP